MVDYSGGIEIIRNSLPATVVRDDTDFPSGRSISATSAAISPGRKVVSAAIAPRAVPERTSFNVGRGTGSATGKQLAKEIRTIANTANGKTPVSQNRFESFMIMASFWS